VLQFCLFLKKAHAFLGKFLIFDLPEKGIFNMNSVDTTFWAGKSVVLRGMFSWQVCSSLLKSISSWN